ncbi:unnamed protein product [Pieris brassicae]|uniref:Uncharacterized protein n=1 Tax=Pieris brassicae TaxID=7116 RepID=A0A9P0TQB2_PIEBR|nr:unnamed protein product [Pieris brassicae]
MSGSSSDSEISACSSKFDPVKALYSDKLKLPAAGAPLYENIQQFEAALKTQKDIIPVGHGHLVKLREEEKHRKKLEEKQLLEEKNKQRFAKYEALLPTKKEKKIRNVLTRIEYIQGPLAALKACVEQRVRVKKENFGSEEVILGHIKRLPQIHRVYCASISVASLPRWTTASATQRIHI